MLNENDLDNDLDLDLDNDLDDEEEGGEDLNLDAPEVPKKNKGGRPKGKRSIGALMSINDPFQFAEAYIMDNPTEPIIMKIRRGGALLSEIDYTQDRAKMKFMTLSAIQKNFGAGIYSFEVYSAKTRRLIREPFSEQLLDHVDFTKSAQGEHDDNVKKENANDFLSSLSALGQSSAKSEGPQNFADQILKYAPLLPIVTQLINALKPKEDTTTRELLRMLVEKQQTAPSPEEMLLKVKMVMQQQEEEQERKQKKMDDEIERRLEKEREMAGIKPEKSLIEQAIEGLSSISKTVEASAKVKAIEAQQRRAKMSHPIKRPVTTVLPPKPSQNVDAVELPESALKNACLNVICKFSELDGDEKKVSDYVLSTPELKNVLNRYESNTICKEVCAILNLTEEPEILRQGIERLYADMRSQQTNTIVQ